MFNIMRIARNNFGILNVLMLYFYATHKLLKEENCDTVRKLQIKYMIFTNTEVAKMENITGMYPQQKTVDVRFNNFYTQKCNAIIKSYNGVKIFLVQINGLKSNDGETLFMQIKYTHILIYPDKSKLESKSIENQYTVGGEPIRKKKLNIKPIENKYVWIPLENYSSNYWFKLHQQEIFIDETTKIKPVMCDKNRQEEILLMRDSFLVKNVLGPLANNGILKPRPFVPDIHLIRKNPGHVFLNQFGLKPKIINIDQLRGYYEKCISWLWLPGTNCADIQAFHKKYMTFNKDVNMKITKIINDARDSNEIPNAQLHDVPFNINKAVWIINIKNSENQLLSFCVTKLMTHYEENGHDTIEQPEWVCIKLLQPNTWVPVKRPLNSKRFDILSKDYIEKVLEYKTNNKNILKKKGILYIDDEDLILSTMNNDLEVFMEEYTFVHEQHFREKYKYGNFKYRIQNNMLYGQPRMVIKLTNKIKDSLDGLHCDWTTIRFTDLQSQTQKKIFLPLIRVDYKNNEYFYPLYKNFADIERLNQYKELDEDREFISLLLQKTGLKTIKELVDNNILKDYDEDINDKINRIKNQEELKKFCFPATVLNQDIIKTVYMVNLNDDQYTYITKIKFQSFNSKYLELQKDKYSDILLPVKPIKPLINVKQLQLIDNNVHRVNVRSSINPNDNNKRFANTLLIVNSFLVFVLAGLNKFDFIKKFINRFTKKNKK